MPAVAAARGAGPACPSPAVAGCAVVTPLRRAADTASSWEMRARSLFARQRGDPRLLTTDLSGILRSTIHGPPALRRWSHKNLQHPQHGSRAVHFSLVTYTRFTQGVVGGEK